MSDANKPATAAVAPGDIKPTEFKPVTSDELEALFSGPAFFANKTFVTVSAAGMRITFGEVGVGGKVSFRTAAFLAYPDAFALRDVLVRQLANVEVIEIPDEKPKNA